MRSLVYLIVLFFAGCSFKPSEQNNINITGSDTMFELTKNLADRFMKENPGISVNVKGGGTATGIKSLINGDIDICTASRNLRPDETKLLAEYYGSIGLVYLVAKDALSIYLNPDNPIKNITLTQLKDIYTGKINNWKNLGGKDTVIAVVSRNPNSGTYLYFKNHVLEGEEYVKNSVIIPTTKEITQYIENNENAIGYGGMGYKADVFYSRIDDVEPSEENVRNDTYPITRYLHFLTTKSPDGVVKKFIDWVLSPSGQSVIHNSGFFPLWDNKL